MSEVPLCESEIGEREEMGFCLGGTPKYGVERRVYGAGVECRVQGAGVGCRVKNIGCRV